MNKYLLLRDNKQTGPYSAAELADKGLKPYDLVWLEGKSAAWRYPSEMEELKPFAPAVEEQPYDRFYKKPAQQVSETITEFKEPVVQQQPPVTVKKIYVTMPAAANKSYAATATATQKEQKEQKEVVEKPVVPITAVATPVTKPVTTPVNNATSFSELVQTSPQQTEQTNYNYRPRQKPDTHKLLLRGIIAACFLLGGVVIGIAITYNSQRSGNQAKLDRLVQQLHEREKQQQAAAQPVTDLPANINTTKELTGESNVAPLQEPKQQAILSTISKKEKTNTELTENTNTATIPVTKEPDVKIVPAVVTNKQEENKPASEAKAAAARQNIHQLVQVEASAFKTGVLGGISELYFTISNNSPYPVDQVEVEIKYLGPEKRVVKVQYLLFNDLAAGGQKTIEAPRTSRGVSIDYVITKINSKALGIAHAGF